MMPESHTAKPRHLFWRSLVVASGAFVLLAPLAANLAGLLTHGALAGVVGQGWFRTVSGMAGWVSGFWVIVGSARAAEHGDDLAVVRSWVGAVFVGMTIAQMLVLYRWFPVPFGGEWVLLIKGYAYLGLVALVPCVGRHLWDHPPGALVSVPSHEGSSRTVPEGSQ